MRRLGSPSARAQTVDFHIDEQPIEPGAVDDPSCIGVFECKPKSRLSPDLGKTGLEAIGREGHDEFLMRPDHRHAQCDPRIYRVAVHLGGVKIESDAGTLRSVDKAITNFDLLPPTKRRKLRALSSGKNSTSRVAPSGSSTASADGFSARTQDQKATAHIVEHHLEPAKTPFCAWRDTGPRRSQFSHVRATLR